MKNLRIEPTDNTPEIDFNAETNHLKLSGESYPENSVQFFEPVERWLTKYIDLDSGRDIVMDCELVMFNSASSKMIMDLLFILNDAAAGEASITVNWRYHEDNDMVEEYGEDMPEDFENLSINLIALSD